MNFWSLLNIFEIKFKYKFSILSKGGVTGLIQVTPRVNRRSRPYKRESSAADSIAHFSSFSRVFASFFVQELSRSPGIIPEPRSKSRGPEDPEKCDSRAEALPARSSIFVKIFQIYRRILLLQAVVLSDHLLIKWVCSYFLLTHNYEVFYIIYVLCVYFVVMCVNVYSLSSIL